MMLMLILTLETLPLFQLVCHFPIKNKCYKRYNIDQTISVLPISDKYKYIRDRDDTLQKNMNVCYYCGYSNNLLAKIKLHFSILVGCFTNTTKILF